MSKTSTKSFTPADAGSSVTVSFTEVDIGEITHVYLNGGIGTDGWCFDEFNILVDDNNNEYRNCSFDFMSYMMIDTDCSGMFVCLFACLCTCGLCM